MKGPEEATVAPWMPLVAARVGLQALDDVLEDISLSAMVTESSLSSACLKTFFASFYSFINQFAKVYIFYF